MSPDSVTFFFYQYDFVVGNKNSCSAGILPGLCIWKNQYPRYSPALGGMWLQMTDA